MDFFNLCNFVQLCNGIGSVVSTQLEDKKEYNNKIIYNYNAQFYPIDENKNSYIITVEYEKSNEHHYLNKISISEKYSAFRWIHSRIYDTISMKILIFTGFIMKK